MADAQTKVAVIPQAAAVIVLDVQQGLFGAHPPPFDAVAVIATINQVIALARQSGAPIFFFQHDGTAAENLVPQTDGWRLHPALDVEPGDSILRKTTCDAFYGTSLEADLRARGIKTIVLTGYATDFCVDSTLRNAVSKDFAVLVVSDAHTTNDSPVLQAKSIRDHHNWAWANCTTKMPVAVVQAAELKFA